MPHSVCSHAAKGGDPTTDNYVTVIGDIAHTLTHDGHDASEDGTGRAAPIVTACFDERQITSKANRCSAKPEVAGTLATGPQTIAFAQRTRDGVKTVEVMKDGIVPALTNPGAGGRSDAINVLAFQTRIARNGRGQPEEIVPALSGADAGATSDMRPCVITPAMSVRRLTPRETERLQGFPDDWSAQFADSTRYKMCGNAVTVSVIRWLAERIKAALE